MEGQVLIPLKLFLVSWRKALAIIESLEMEFSEKYINVF